MQTIRSTWSCGRTQSSETLDIMTFRLGEQEYGVDLAKVRELRSYDPVIRIADAPRYIRGSINLPGRRVPLLDMRIALGFDTPVPAESGDVIIFDLAAGLAGVAVDDVVDVVTLGPGQIDPPPASGGLPPANCLIGIGKLPGRHLILIDIESFLRSEALSFLGRLAA